MVMTPTISSPSSEDFSGLTLVDCAVAGGKVVPKHVNEWSETFDSKNETDFTWGANADVSAGKLIATPGGNYLTNRIIRKVPLQKTDKFSVAILYYSSDVTASGITLYCGYSTAWAQPQCWIYRTNATVAGGAGPQTWTGVSTTFPTQSGSKAVFDGENFELFYLGSSGWVSLGIATMRAGPWVDSTPHIYVSATSGAAGPSCTDMILENEYAPVAELPTMAAFQPTGGLNLARLVSITPTLDSTGASGTVTLYMQKYGTEHGWTSLGGVADAWTSLGACVSGVPFDLSSYEMRGGAKTRWKAEFTSTDGTLPPPALSGLALAWESDTDAPGVPTITQLLSTCGVGGVGPRPVIQISSLPTGARHIEVEVDRKPAGGDWAGSLPLSGRNAIESGQGYLELRGALEQEQGAGEENALHLAVPGTWTVGDEVRAKARAVDAMGNASAWTDTAAAVEITQPYPAPTITEVTPTPLAEAGGTEITITGTGFIDGATVTVAGDACTDVVVVSDTEITATTPAAEYGAGTLTVTNSDGQSAAIGVQVGTSTYVPVLVQNWRATWGGSSWRAVWR